MLDEISYYRTHHGNLITTLDSPNKISLFFSKTVASTYLLLTECLNGLANGLSSRLSRTFEDIDIPSLERDWNDRQSWIPRPTEYIDKVQEILFTIGQENLWMDTKPGFQLLRRTLLGIKASARPLLGVVLVSLATEECTHSYLARDFLRAAVFRCNRFQYEWTLPALLPGLPLRFILRPYSLLLLLVMRR